MNSAVQHLVLCSFPLTKSSRAILLYPPDAIKEPNMRWKNMTKPEVVAAEFLSVRACRSRTEEGNLFQRSYEFIENAANRKGSIIWTGQR